MLESPRNEREARAFLDAFGKYDSIRHCARETGIPRTTIGARRDRAESLLCEHDIPSNQQIKGVSTLYKDGKKVIEWVKTDVKKQQAQEAFNDAIESLNDRVARELPKLPPIGTADDLASCYVLTDYHLGQMAWSGETGNDWDMDIALDLLKKWFGSAINTAPNSKIGILAQLGDFLHWDGLEAVTPSSGHVLDADTRFSQLVELAIKAIREVIGMMLEKHEIVHVIMAEGNHDLASSVWLRALFSTLYENEPRVTIDNTHSPYYCYEWGKTSLFFHHGHKQRMANISTVFAGLYRHVFGRTTYSYAHMGHLHHVESKENQMMIVEQHPTLAGRDAHSSRGGYLSKRAANIITYSKTYGEVSRVTIRPEMVS